MRTTLRIARAAALGVVAIGWAVASSTTAFAHTEVRRASPSPGEVVVDAVDSVDLQFLDPVLPTVDISVRSLDGGPVAGLGEVTHSDDALGATVSFDPLTVAGGYVVDYRYVAVDGDAQADAYRFSFDPGSSDDDSNMIGLLALSGVLMGGAGAVIVAIRRRSVQKH